MALEEARNRQDACDPTTGVADAQRQRTAVTCRVATTTLSLQRSLSPELVVPSAVRIMSAMGGKRTTGWHLKLTAEPPLTIKFGEPHRVAAPKHCAAEVLTSNRAPSSNPFVAFTDRLTLDSPPGY